MREGVTDLGKTTMSFAAGGALVFNRLHGMTPATVRQILTEPAYEHISCI